jgi:hypothetical protein
MVIALLYTYGPHDSLLRCRESTHLEPPNVCLYSANLEKGSVFWPFFQLKAHRRHPIHRAQRGALSPPLY